MGQLFNNSRFFRNDGEYTAFAAMQLTSVVEEIADEVYAALEYSDHIPVLTNVHPASQNIRFDKYTHVGMAEIFRGSGEDLPTADVSRDTTFIPVFDIGIKSELLDLEAEQAKLAEVADRAMGITNPIRIDREKERAAALGVAFKHNELAIAGDSQTGLLGLTNQPNIGSFPILNGGGGSPLWEQKTADEIIADLTGLLSFTISTAKVKLYHPNRLLLPEDKWLIASQKRLPNSDMSALEWFQNKNPLGSALQVKSWNRLNGMGPGGTGLAFCYKMDPSVIAYRPVVNYRIGPPTRKLLGTAWAHIGRSAGVTVPRPFAVSKAQGF